MTKSNRIGLVLVVAATALWSTIEVVVRTIVDRITPIQLAGARFILAGLCLGAVLPFVLRRKGLRLTRRILLHASWMAVIGVFIPSIAIQYALDRAGAAVVATVWGTMPLLVMVLAVVVLREPLTRPKVLGVILGFLGIVVLATSEPSATFSLSGLVFAVASTASFSVFTVIVKRVAGRFAGLPFISLCILFGAAYLAPVMLIEGEASTLAELEALWVPVLYLGAIATGVSYYCYFAGLERVEATQAASVAFLKPPLAAVLAAVWLGESISWNVGAGLALVLGGLYFVVFVSRRARIPAPTPSATADTAL
ncbi:MAG: DMT family transporter [Candidatus Hydrogenedentes bacterium]|nr:DMT family transporter [Candidatus Hydrogenedentota bacterium]